MKHFCLRTVAGTVCASLLLTASAAAFDDTAAHWSRDAVAFVTQKGLMNGVSAYTFAPDLPMTRGMLVTVLYRMDGSPLVSGATPFADVPDTQYYAAAVRWAVANGIVTGITPTIFAPDENIEREQLAAILYRYAQYKTDTLPQTGALDRSAFADGAAVLPYAQNAVDWSLSSGLLSGKPGGLLDPRGGATRAEIATILTRYADAAALDLPDAEDQTQTETHSYEAFSTSLGPVTRTDTTVTDAAAVHLTREYSDTAGCTVQMRRVTTSAALPAHRAAQLTLSGMSGTVRRYDRASDRWIVQPLAEGVLPYGMYFIQAGGTEGIFVTPQVYADRENGMIEYLPDYSGTLRLSKQGDRFVLTAEYPALPAGVHGEFLSLQSTGLLIDWLDPASLARWSNYRLTDDNRWCTNGYYYTAPSDYFPTGPNYFYNLPAAHIAGKMARDAGQPASRALGLAMMDVMHEHRNALGFIPSLSGSNWLKNDYGIGPGYFDTRFNTDFATADLNAAENFGVTEWLDDAIKYGEFLLTYGAEHHLSVGPSTDDGWLMEDYWHPDGNSPTHASLNHHVATMIFLYRLSDMTGENSYAALADKMLRGVELTEGAWIMPNGNLEYAYNPDGTMGSGTDYPSLTYNDLFDLQQVLVQRSGAANPSIARLMDSKRGWMDANGITDYKK